MALSERVKNQKSSHASRHRELAGFGGREEFYHQQVRPSTSASSRVSIRVFIIHLFHPSVILSLLFSFVLTLLH